MPEPCLTPRAHNGTSANIKHLGYRRYLRAAKMLSPLDGLAVT
jgi:hypothetical protein